MTKLSARHAPLAQLDRASDYGSEGQEFESLRAYQKSQTERFGSFAFLGSCLFAKSGRQGAFHQSPYEVVNQNRYLLRLPKWPNCGRNFLQGVLLAGEESEPGEEMLLPVWGGV